MRRLALLFAGGAIWLLLAAVPVLADGGPHVSTINNGSGGITADSCAGCHRAHTAQAPSILLEEAPALCLTCHGSASTGAVTDVMTGVQYALSTDPTKVRDSTAVLGALRGGGFAEARIDSANTARLAYPSTYGGVTYVREHAMVPVSAAGQAVTSTHMDVNGLAPSVVWGNGAINTSVDPGGTTELNCTSCHNPHGNGQYRILNPIPTGEGGTMVAAPTAAPVADAPLPAAGDTRNYTVIQKMGTQGDDSTYLLYASQVAGTYANTVGDYLHRALPWDADTGSKPDAPNGQPITGTFGGNAETAFNTQITAWCSQCHTRYLTPPAALVSHPQEVASGDALFMYRHGTDRTPCTTCHVAHGSNAQMTGVYSANMEYPGGALAPLGDSRLLKIDNRGTCQACHDPTGTITVGTYIGPVPTPVVP